MRALEIKRIKINMSCNRGRPGIRLLKTRPPESLVDSVLENEEVKCQKPCCHAMNRPMGVRARHQSYARNNNG